MVLQTPLASARDTSPMFSCGALHQLAQQVDVAELVREQLHQRLAGDVAEAVGAGRRGDAVVALNGSTTAGLLGVRATVWIAGIGGDATLSGDVANAVLGPETEVALIEAGEAGEAGSGFAEVRLDQPGVAVERTRLVGLADLPIASLRLREASITSWHEADNATQEAIAIAVADARLRLVAIGLGLAQRALVATLDHVVDRPFAGGRLVNQQAVRHALAEVSARLEVSLAHLMRVAALPPQRRECAAAAVAVVAGRAISDSVEVCCQFFGGRGFLDTYWISYAFRDGALFPALLGDERMLLDRLGRQLKEEDRP
jgi:alkylation response protein AidB-like acyl-CoA dehydrogenase